MPTGVQAACDIKDIGLAESGRRRTEWAFQSMPVLRSIRKNLTRNQPFAGIRIAACLHVTTETANLILALLDGGASVSLCSPNPSTTQDDVAAYLVKDHGVSVFANRGGSDAEYYEHLSATLDIRPMITLDDGAGLVHALHTRRSDAAGGVIGGTEETTTGVVRLKALARDGALRYPIIAINDAMTKHLFDNRHGTGQSTMDGILRATNILLAGMNIVVAGYGWCGRGVATRARGLGANVIVCEVDAIKALEALMDGYRVMSMIEAAPIGDVFVTVTGNKSVITGEHFDRLKNGAILCNSGHFNVEIDLEALNRMASPARQVREFVDEFVLRDGRRICVLGEGRLINVASGEGNPASVMDMSFANQALAVEHLVKNHAALGKMVYAMPEELDRQVARLKLEAMGVKIDRLSVEQEQYMTNWSEGA